MGSNEIIALVQTYGFDGIYDELQELASKLTAEEVLRLQWMAWQWRELSLLGDSQAEQEQALDYLLNLIRWQELPHWAQEYLLHR